MQVRAGHHELLQSFLVRKRNRDRRLLWACATIWRGWLEYREGLAHLAKLAAERQSGKRKRPRGTKKARREAASTAPKLSQAAKSS